MPEVGKIRTPSVYENGDMRLSLNISAELADLEYWNILSGYMTDHFDYVGPLLWEPNTPDPAWLDQVAPDRPTVYVTIGSTGDPNALRSILSWPGSAPPNAGRPSRADRKPSPLPSLASNRHPGWRSGALLAPIRPRPKPARAMRVAFASQCAGTHEMSCRLVNVCADFPHGRTLGWGAVPHRNVRFHRREVGGQRQSGDASSARPRLRLAFSIRFLALCNA